MTALRSVAIQAARPVMATIAAASPTAQALVKSEALTRLTLTGSIA